MTKRMLHIFDKICLLITFAVFLFLHNDMGFCMMPGGNDGGVNLGLIEAYRPIMNRLPAESSSQYLFQYLEELNPIIRAGRLFAKFHARVGVLPILWLSTPFRSMPRSSVFVT